MLSKSQWPLFEYIDLSRPAAITDFNQIGNEGLAYLVLAAWPNLREINLGSIVVSKLTTG